MAITEGVFFHAVFLLLFVVGSHATGQQVTDLKFLQISSDTATVTWTAPKQQHDYIKSFHVTITNRDTNEQHEIETTSSEKKFANLTPYTLYYIKVRTENWQLNGNGGGLGEPVQIELTTAPLAGQQVTDIKFLHIGTETATVTWKAPNQPHGDIKSYHVTITNRDTKEQQTVERTSNGIIFPNLTPHTWYDITVRTENWQLNGNGGGLGEPVFIILLTERLAGQKVTDIKIPYIGTDIAMVTWTAPNQPHEDIKSYHVTVTNRDTKEQRELETTSNNITFPNLTPHTLYDITVRTENRRLYSNGGGLGEPVLLELATAPLAGQKVRDISFPDIGSYAINVQWMAPEMSFGEITSYRVETTDAKGKRKAERDVFETKATISNLCPFTAYNISVRTINKPMYVGYYYGGPGEAVTNVVTTLPLAGQKVTDTQIPHIGTDTATVTWTAPNQPHGDITSYHVTVTNRDTKAQQHVETTSHGIKFSNLTPHTLYDLTVRTENRRLNSNGGGLGEPVLLELSTAPLGREPFSNTADATMSDGCIP